jgi:two-component system, NtrC family, nitrogen regulation response regulator GlnG
MSKRILIVDDDAELAAEMAEVLRDQDYVVDSASDSVHGAQLICENTYDLYLLDYKMAGFTGVDLLKKIKEKKDESVIFIISGRPSIDKLLQQENVLHLVSAVIRKPFDVEVLLNKIKALPHASP